MFQLVRKLWSEDAGQDIAEYAVMLAVILVLVVGTVRLIGTNFAPAAKQLAGWVAFWKGVSSMGVWASKPCR